MSHALQVREYMDVISSDRKMVGKVDHLDGCEQVQAHQAELA